MDIATKRKAALAALDNHGRRYKVSIPDRVRAFYTGDFDRYHLLHAKGEISGWSSEAFQLALTPPTWLNKDDDAVNGPRGEWKDARNHIPLFVTSQQVYVVVNISKPGCPVGWYQEENFRDGTDPAADTLDGFLAGLTKTQQGTDLATPADPDQEMDWAEDFGDDGPRAFDVVHDE